MFFKIATICIVSWLSSDAEYPPQIEKSSEGSIAKEDSTSYKHTITPLIIVDEGVSSSNKLINLPTPWIITKKR